MELTDWIGTEVSLHRNDDTLVVILKGVSMLGIFVEEEKGIPTGTAFIPWQNITEIWREKS